MLPNGLRVWVQEDHSRPVALVQVDYRVGALNESPGATGTAHYVEHMVYRATEHIRNEDIYGYIDRIGGRYTGGTSRDGTSYGELVPSWALESALRTTAERMSRARFDSTEFERERNNVVTEANGFARLDPVNALHDEVMLTSFELHPYRYSSNTWAQDNLLLTRGQAFDFYKNFYGPNNAVLTVVGDVTPAGVRTLVESYFRPLPRAPRSGAAPAVEPPQRAEKRVTLRYVGDRKQLEIVYRAPPAGSGEFATLAVLDRVLRGRLASRIGTARLTTRHEAAAYPYVYDITLAGDSALDLDRLLVTVQEEIDRLRTDPISDSDLQSARTPDQPAGVGRGANANADPSANVPPRQTDLSRIADELQAREVFSWTLSAAQSAREPQAERSVQARDIVAYVDRWLRASQRTVGFLTPGRDDYMPQWSIPRALAGTRLEVPPLTTPPAPRQRPSPVPPRALEPLSPLRLRSERRTLPNGIVVGAATTEGTGTSVHVRVGLPLRGQSPDSDAFMALAERMLRQDAGLRRIGARISAAPIEERFIDIAVSGAAATAADAATTIAHALRRDISAVDIQTALANTTGGAQTGAGARGAVARDARKRVLDVIAPSLTVLSPPAAPALSRISASEINDFFSAHFAGANITVGIAGPDTPARLLEIANEAFTPLSTGERIVPGRLPSVNVRATETRIAAGAETQVTVLAGLPAVRRGDPDARALELLAYIVGVPSYGGRLGWALTKSGLTYSSSTITTFGAATGHILISTKTDTRNLDASVQAIREVVAGVADRGVEEWEIREAKAFVLGRMLLYGVRDDSGDDAIAGALVDSQYYGTPLLDLPAWSRDYLAVTRDQINAVARRYYRPDRLDIVAIGAIPQGAHASPFAPGTFRRLFER